MSQQKSGLVPGILVGLAAMVVGAGLYGAFIAITKYEFGLVTSAIGVLVGLGITAVKPTSQALPVIAAAMGLAGAALGQVLGTAIYVVTHSSVGIGPVLAAILGDFPAFVADDPLSVVFWAIGGWAAFSFVSKRVNAAAVRQAAPVYQNAAPASAGGSWTPAPPPQEPLPPQAQPPQG